MRLRKKDFGFNKLDAAELRLLKKLRLKDREYIKSFPTTPKNIGDSWADTVFVNLQY